MCDEMSITSRHQKNCFNKGFSVLWSSWNDSESCIAHIVSYLLHVLLTHMLIKTGAEQSIKCSVLFVLTKACYCVCREHTHNIDIKHLRKLWRYSSAEVILYIQSMFAAVLSKDNRIPFRDIGDIWRPCWCSYTFQMNCCWAQKMHWCVHFPRLKIPSCVI